MVDTPARAVMPRLPASVAVQRAALPSDHLHFGVYAGGRPATTLEEAQEAMLARVIALLPPPPARILHVECGLGLTSLRLAERGYTVTAIAADPELAAHAAAAHPHPALTFHAAGLVDDGGDVAAAAPFDAVLIHEAAVVLAVPGEAFRRARALLADGGVLVLGGETAGGGPAGAGGPRPTADDITIALGGHGFRPLEREPIGTLVAPTCAAMCERLSAFAAEPEADHAALAATLAEWERRRADFAAGTLDYELLAARKDRFVIGAFRDGDEHEILALFREVFGVPRTLAHWYWKFRDNPYGDRRIAETRTAEGELVAHYAGYPVPFYSSAGGGRELIAHQIGDTMTRPSVRQAGLGKNGILARMAAYYYAAFCAGIPFAYGFNTGHIRTLGKRYLGYEYIDPIAHWVLEAPARALARAGRLARWLSGWSVTEITRAGRELDELLERVRDSYGLLVRRDATYVRWRYLDCPDRAHRVFGVWRRGRLVGWCAFARRGPALVWGDALVEQRHAAGVALLLRHCVDEPYAGVERIWGWFAPHPRWWSAALASFGFARTQEPNDLAPGFYFLARPKMLDELRERWYYTYGDSDLF